jgi:hypothetical protein
VRVAAPLALGTPQESGQDALGGGAPSRSLVEEPDVDTRTGHGHTIDCLDAHGLMARWVGYDRDSLHRNQVCLPEKHSINVERDVKLTTDALIVCTPLEHATMQPVTSLSQPPGTPQSTAETTPAADTPETPEQASTPGSTSEDRLGGLPPTPMRARRNGQQATPSPLTSLSHTPSPHQPLSALKKPKAMTMLPV